jgi:chorismate-pyruvate lyase
VNRELNLLFPLDTFYAERGIRLPSVTRIGGYEMPDPYRKLLVGEHDMTPTLESFHGGQIELRVLDHHVGEGTYSRLVDLVVIDTGKVVEFGAIVIHLQHFPKHARELILEEHCPLGSILAQERVEHASCPQAFLRVESDTLINEALGLTGDRSLYGRRNYLLAKDDRVLADIIEILPP